MNKKCKTIAMMVVLALLSTLVFVPVLAQDGGTVSIIGSYNEKFVADFIPLIEEMSGCKIEYEAAPLQYNDRNTKFTAMLASGDSSFDIFDIDELMQLSFTRAGFLEPITDVVAQTDLDSFLPGYKEAFLEYNGDVYAVPNTLSGVVFFCNKLMFEEVGLEYPTTQQEFVDSAIALTKDGNFGMVETWDKDYFHDAFNRWCHMFGGDFYDWQNPGTQDALKFMYDLLNTYKVVSKDSLTENTNTGAQKMIDGLGAMYFNWGGLITNLQAAGKYGVEVELVPMPTFKTNQTVYSSWMWVINKNGGNVEGAKRVVAALATPQLQAAYVKARNAGPCANTRVWSDPVLSDGIWGIKEYQDMLEVGTLQPRIMTTKHTEFKDIVTPIFQRYVLDEIGFEECIETGTRELERLVASAAK